MDVVFICPRGHRTPIDPGIIKAKAYCAKCKKEIDLLPAGDGRAGATWLIVAHRGELPHLATPLPVGKKLKLGAANNLWLRLEGDGVGELHAELQLKEVQRIHVTHRADDGKTWIDKAVVLEGVVGPDNELRIGDYAMRVGSTMVVQRIAKADALPVLVVDEFGDELDEVEPQEKKRARPARSAGRFAEWSTRQKATLIGATLLTVASLAYLGWVFMYPSVSDQMPADTAYTCPRDGTQFRGAWDAGPPKCPNCGALCFGSVRYDVSTQPGETATQPGETPENQQNSATAETSLEPEP